MRSQRQVVSADRLTSFKRFTRRKVLMNPHYGPKIIPNQSSQLITLQDGLGYSLLSPGTGDPNESGVLRANPQGLYRCLGGLIPKPPVETPPPLQPQWGRRIEGHLRLIVKLLSLVWRKWE